MGASSWLRRSPASLGMAKVQAMLDERRNVRTNSSMIKYSESL